MSSPARLALVALLLGCPPGAEDSAGTAPRWFSTCGDPVCSAYDRAQHTNPVCTTQVQGDACAPEGDGCDPQDACNAELVCATEDPTAGEGGCPISLRSAKTEIRYVDRAERAALHDAVMGVRLADYRYRTEPAGGKHHLGFLIDEQPAGSPAVLPSGERVDLYGYTSMAVAALQVQADRIAVQADRIAAQDARIAALEARLSALER